jgi:hypothetical protein
VEANDVSNGNIVFRATRLRGSDDGSFTDPGMSVEDHFQFGCGQNIAEIVPGAI